MAPIPSIAGPNLPLDASFDFAAWRKTPEDVIRSTRNYERELQEDRIPLPTQDVGPKLAASLYYGYTEDEWSRMFVDPYCEHVVNPVPAHLMDVMLKKPSMKMNGVTQISPLTRPPVVIPLMFLVAIKLKLHPAFFWFTDKRPRFAEENPGDLPTKKNHGDLGLDDTAEGTSILTWSNAMENLIEAPKILSAAADPSSPHSYAEEMQKHFNFVKNLDNFEELFDVWYPVEKSLRNKILTNNRAYFGC
ncbi:hypothetical protein B0H12DRAFT_1323602 [Mycena haematopus]|nr:hypothetical protein B0H12DRAFT_1323602 [Mycena haematopus]